MRTDIRGLQNVGVNIITTFVIIITIIIVIVAVKNHCMLYVCNQIHTPDVKYNYIRLPSIVQLSLIHI